MDGQDDFSSPFIRPKKGMDNMKVDFICPRCRGPLSIGVQIDRGDPELKDLPPVILQVRRCGRCGFSDVKVLQGLPDDERTYLEWARDEADILTSQPQAFEPANGLAS